MTDVYTAVREVKFKPFEFNGNHGVTVEVDAWGAVCGGKRFEITPEAAEDLRMKLDVLLGTMKKDVPEAAVIATPDGVWIAENREGRRHYSAEMSQVQAYIRKVSSTGNRDKDFKVEGPFGSIEWGLFTPTPLTGEVKYWTHINRDEPITVTIFND